jgi:hypothetical protein
LALPAQYTTLAGRRPRDSPRRGFGINWRRIGEGFWRSYSAGAASDGGKVGVSRPEARMERRSWGEVAEKEDGGGD